MTTQVQDAAAGPQPWLHPWPAEGLEAVGSCPVCGGVPRAILHREVGDNVLFCAPGDWTLWRCSGCQCAYLDPRPTSASIHLAYENYHTHSAPAVLPAERGLARLKRSLSNGYKNWRFGTDLQPATRLGVPVTRMMPPIRARIDREFRHLPCIPGEGRVLDVGFGDGTFLESARLAGWRGVGIDFDPEVVRNARARGLDVSQSSLEALDEPAASFDVITVAHVIEHVHHPASWLARCFHLLKPGGVLWLETPNIDSLGHLRFGRNWRGLEVPRHMAIFNRTGLRNQLRQAGFMDIRDLPQAGPCRAMFTMSDRMRRGCSPYQDEPISLRLRLEIAIAQFLETCLGPSRKEFLAMVATKPM